MLHIAELWLPIIGGGFLFAWGFAALYGGSKVHAIWLIFGGVVCLLLLAALQLQESVRRQTSDQPANVPSAADVIRERAYVAPFDATVSNPFGESPTVAVTIKNTGQSPAYALTWRAQFSITTFPVIPELTLDEKVVAPPYVLQPGDTLFYQWTFDKIDSVMADRLSKGTAAIVAIGEINYRDAFGNDRNTTFKLFSANTPGVSPGKFANAPDGNEAD